VFIVGVILLSVALAVTYGYAVHSSSPNITSVTSISTTVATTSLTKTASSYSSTTESSASTVTTSSLSSVTDFYVTCDQAVIMENQNTNCHAFATFFGTNPPAGEISFSVNPSGSGTFTNLNCMTQPQPPQPGSSYQMHCDVQYSPSKTGTQMITATYSGDQSYAPASAQFSIEVNSGP
jgi:hypothetical protein